MAFDSFDSSMTSVARPDLLGMREATAGTNGRLWGYDDPKMDEKGRVVRGGMWSHQRQWWMLPDFFKVLVGGYGAGKTMIGCKRIIALALENAPCYVAVVSPTFPLARHTVIATIEALLAGKQTLLGRQAFWFRYNKSTHEFKIRYRGRLATIIIYSGEHPDSLRGPNLAAAYLDEPFLMEQAVFEQMVARVRHPDAKLSELFMTGTPEQLNWGYELCMGELKDRLESMGVENQSVGVVQASTRGNLALPENYVKRLEGTLADKSADAYIEGKFVNLAQGLVYYGFDAMPGGVHITTEGDPDVNGKLPDGVELGAGMDFNVNPMSAAAFWRAGNRMHFFKEYQLPNADTEYACQQLRDDFKDKLNVIYPDASGNSRKTSAPQARTDYWYIRQAGFEIRAPHANPKRKDRYNAVNGKFRPKVGPMTLTVSPKCRKLVKFLATHSHEMMTKQVAMTHLLDAFSYPVHYLFPIAKETLTVGRLLGT